MIQTTIKDYKAQAMILQQEIKEIVCEMDDSNYNEQLREISVALEKSQPSLMFYGIYNAGKSTLLNAIFGEEVASVNDIPETHKVTLYEWGKYILADTPGLNGPPEDEVITAAEVMKHDIVMFVIDDSDNFDSDVITKKIIEILETKKPCIIVINRKNDSDKEKILAIKTKMNKNIKTLSSIVQNYEFVDVDAISALKAKKEEKQLLLEKSNIEELEYCISNKLVSVNSVQMLCVPLELIVKLSREIKTSIKNEVRDENLKQLYQLKEKIFQLREQIAQEFKISLNRQIEQYGQEIYNKASINKQEDINEKKYEEQIKQLTEQYMNKFLQHGKIAWNQFSEEYKMNLQLRSVPNEMSEKNFSSNKKGKDEVDKLLDVLINIPISVPTPTPIPLPVIVATIKVLKKWIFGSGKEEMPDVEEWNRQQEEYVEKRTMALKELKNQIDMQMEEYRQSVSKDFDEMLNMIYNKSIMDIDCKLQEEEGESKIKQQRMEIVESLEIKAERLLNEIRSQV